jgi:hypothetical protein
MNPLKSVKSSIKKYVVGKGLEQAQAAIDTQPEREQIAKVVVEGLHLPGLPKSYAWVVAIVSALINMLLEVLAASDPAQLLTDWHVYAHAVGVAFVGKFFLWIRQNSDNGTAVIEQRTIRALDDVAGVR